MAQRVPNPGFKIFTVTVEDPPEGLSDEKLRALIEGAIRDVGTPIVKKATKKTRKVVLRNRHTRKDGRFPCTQKVAGLSVVGCGRTFASEKSLEKHMDLKAGIWSNSKQWPNGCLDAIVTPDVRDDR